MNIHLRTVFRLSGAVADKCGFQRRLIGEDVHAMRKRLLAELEKAVDSGLPVPDGHLLSVREMHARRKWMPANAPPTLISAVDFLRKVKTAALYGAELPLQEIQEWGKRAGVVFKPDKPAWCVAAGPQGSDSTRRANMPQALSTTI